MVTIAAIAFRVTEGWRVGFTVQPPPPPVSALAVSVDVTGTGATLAALGAQTLTVTISGNATQLTLATEDDSNIQADSIVTATITSKRGQGGYTVSSPAWAAVTFLDDNEPPAMRIVSAVPSPVLEGESMSR